MSEAESPRRLGRSVVAVLARFIAGFVLSLGTGLLLHAFGIFPKLGERMSDPLFLLATVYRTVYGVVGSYITARLAPYREMLHAFVGGAIGVVLASVGAAATWNHVPSLGPHWYPLALIATAMPTAWLGARIWQMQLQTRRRRAMYKT